MTNNVLGFDGKKIVSIYDSEARRLRDKIMDSLATHGWVLKLIPVLEQKDPVDVLHDLSMLAHLWRMKVREQAKQDITLA